MPKHYEDEILPSGARLRHYFKAGDYDFPNEYIPNHRGRYSSRNEAIAALLKHREDRAKAEVRDSFTALRWADLEDLRRCPNCFAIVEAGDVLIHHQWHSESGH